MNKIANILLFVGLNLLDSLTTKIVLSLGGTEANPVAIFLSNSFPEVSIYAIKGVVIMILLAFWILYKPFGFDLLRLIPPLNIVLLGIVIWNVTFLVGKLI